MNRRIDRQMTQTRYIVLFDHRRKGWSITQITKEEAMALSQNADNYNSIYRVLGNGAYVAIDMDFKGEPWQISTVLSIRSPSVCADDSSMVFDLAIDESLNH